MSKEWHRTVRLYSNHNLSMLTWRHFLVIIVSDLKATRNTGISINGHVNQNLDIFFFSHLKATKC